MCSRSSVSHLKTIISICDWMMEIDLNIHLFPSSWSVGDDVNRIHTHTRYQILSYRNFIYSRLERYICTGRSMMHDISGSAQVTSHTIHTKLFHLRICPGFGNNKSHNIHICYTIVCFSSCRVVNKSDLKMMNKLSTHPCELPARCRRERSTYDCESVNAAAEVVGCDIIINIQRFHLTWKKNPKTVYLLQHTQ